MEARFRREAVPKVWFCYKGRADSLRQPLFLEAWLKPPGALLTPL
jgi:hypothetical protein